MTTLSLETSRLTLQLSSVEETRSMLDSMPDEVREQVSQEWLERIQSATTPDPWLHGFKVIKQDDSSLIGQCGFKGPPSDGSVEIAYQINEDQQNCGFATESASALYEFAAGKTEVNTVIAHTLPTPNASTRVLEKCGFENVGEVVDPDDGTVWQWRREVGQSS